MLMIICSTLLRLLSYFFLRWLPGALFPKIVVGLYFVYLAGMYLEGNVTKNRRTIWHCLGSPGTKFWNRWNMLVNTSLVVLVLDATFGDWLLHDHRDLTFSKVGHVSESSAKITIRSPLHKRVNVCYRPRSGMERNVDCEVFYFEDDPVLTDFTLTGTISNLSADTVYDYIVKSLEDTTQISSGLFKTASSAPCKWSFLVSSCIIPNFPYSPVRRNHFIGWDQLYEHEIHEKDVAAIPSFMFFLGDFLYYDLPYYPRFSLDAYFKKYRMNYASNFQKVIRKLPFLHVYDDHDIINNYDAGENSVPFPMAHQSFQAYHGHSNPSPRLTGQSWSTFTYGSVGFFMMDTRRYRSRNNVKDDESKTMLGAQQLADLLAWIADDEHAHFKVLVSSIPFTENWKGVDGHLDTWGGFLTERLKILTAIDRSRKDIIVISGDRHEFASTIITSQTDRKAAGKAIEFSISPLNQFYLPIPTYSSQVNDTELKYLPHGNVKWGKFSVDTTGEIPKMDFELKIHGVSAWNHTMYGTL